MFFAVEPPTVITHLLDPSQLLLIEDHRATGRGNPPMNEGLFQPAVLLIEVGVLGCSILCITHAFTSGHGYSSCWGRSSRISYHAAFEATNMWAIGLRLGASISDPYGTRILPS
jgi:hypothetical protein